MKSVDNSAEKMVAEPIDPMTAPPDAAAPAMALALHGVADSGTSDATSFNISSGTSSPFTSPDMKPGNDTRKRRGPRSSSPSIAWPFPERMSSPMRPDLFERVVHRRAMTPEDKGDTEGNLLKKIVEQLNADHDYMEQLKDAIVTVNQRLDAQRATTQEIRGWGEKVATSIIKLERRSQEDEASIAEMQQTLKRASAKVEVIPGELNTAVEKRFPELLTVHLQALVQDVNDLKAHTANASQHQKGMEEYLQQLNSERPAEGRTVVSAFQHLENQLIQVKNQLALQQQGGGGGGGGPDHHGKVMANSTDGWRCHCDHVAYHEARINQIEQTHAERINGLFETVAVISGLISADSAAAPGPCGGPCTGCGSAASSSQQLPGAMPSLTAAFSGRAAGGCGGCGRHGPGGQQPPEDTPPVMAPPGIPGECHCRHVVELQRLVAELQRGIHELRARPAQRDATPDAWQQYLDREGRPAGPAQAPTTTSTSTPLPLHYGPLGALLHSKYGLFDDKLTAQSEYKFDGSKGGDSWKGKIERYFISKVPALKNIFIWAEKIDMEVVDETLLERAVVKPDGMDRTQMELLNSAIWGFLSGCLGGEAETMFKQAESLNGIDAWRRVVRYIDHGRSIRLETLRDEVRALHTKPIKNVEHVAVGIAEFENKIREYEAAGGKKVDDDEKKNDLLKILPGEISSALLWRASEPGGYQLFRDMVVRQSAKVMMNKRRLPLHAINEESLAQDCEQESVDFSNISSVEDLVAAVQRAAAGGRGRFGQRAAAPGGRRAGPGNARDTGTRQPPAARRPRHCPNCSLEHEGRCNKPEVPRNERTCWGCGKKDHLSRDCPERKGKSVGQVTDDDIPIFGLNMIDNEGFELVSRKKGAPNRPVPHAVTMGDYIGKAKFGFERLPDSGDADERPRSSRRMTPAKESGALGAFPLTRQPKPKLLHAEGFDDDLEAILRREFGSINKILNESEDPVSTRRPENIPWKRAQPSGAGELDLVVDDVEDEPINAVHEHVKVAVAIDSGAVDNTLPPSELPETVEVEENKTGKHFVGAGGDQITKFGTCMTLLEGQAGKVGCKWQVADVTRPLHSVSRITGPADGPGHQDVLFNNKKAVVVPPGIVEKILQSIKPVAQYNREQGLYVANMTMSGFTRPGPAR